MSMEKICYEEPDSCYSCKSTFEDCDCLVCKNNLKVKSKLMFNNLSANEMEVEYRRAVIRAKNCLSYSKREILIS